MSTRTQEYEGVQMITPDASVNLSTVTMGLAATGNRLTDPEAMLMTLYQLHGLNII
jgi:hypothetical protein